MATTTVFSEFELREMAVKFNGETSASYIHMDCVGECEEEMEVRVVTKKCRGKVKKTRVKGTGTGTLKLSAHVPYNIFTKAFGMENAKTIDGVMSYGEIRHTRHSRSYSMCTMKMTTRSSRRIRTAL